MKRRYTYLVLLLLFSLAAITWGPERAQAAGLGKVERSSFGIAKLDQKNSRCSFQAKISGEAGGYELKVYQGSKCLKTLEAGKGKATGYFAYEKKKLYKYRVRPKQVNPDSGKVTYGAWSPYRYFMDPGLKKSYSSDRSGIELKLKKLSGISKYQIYVSTSAEGTYKKTRTISVSEGSKTIHLKKIGDRYMKANKTYYLRLVPMIKSGDQLVKSDIVGSAKMILSTKKKSIGLKKKWKYASFSKIHTGKAVLYPAPGTNARGITVCVNAGHGTKGGEKEMTYSHPDKSPKCTGGTNGEGAVKSMAISGGTDMKGGKTEAEVTLKLAKIVKKDLLKAGYNVLMIRESEDVQLDNIARTVIANNCADLHISLHYDGTASDKGAFFISVPDNKAYRSMEPVKHMWKSHHRLGRNLVEGLKKKKVKIWSSGELPLDLTQTSFSTIPSVDLEVGDQASDYSKKSLEKIASGIVKGLASY